MRKLVFVIAASIVFIACNQPSNGVKNEVKTDSVSVNVDSTQVVLDSTVSKTGKK